MVWFYSLYEQENYLIYYFT